MANVLRRACLCLLGGLMAAALVGCGVSSYQLRFGSEIKEKQAVQVYVYFAPEHEVPRCEKLTAAEVFGDSEREERSLQAVMLKSAVITHGKPSVVRGEGFDATVGKVFVWGNFPEQVKEGDDRCVISTELFQKSSFLSSEGLLEIPVLPTGFGTPR